MGGRASSPIWTVSPSLELSIDALFLTDLDGDPPPLETLAESMALLADETRRADLVDSLPCFECLRVLGASGLWSRDLTKGSLEDIK